MCPGDVLNLMCGTNQTFLRWNISAPAVGISGESQSLFNGISFIGVIKISSCTVTFNVSVLSGTVNFPLRSEILAENVTADLNGTTITCLEIIPDQGPGEITRNVSTTRIHIIGNEALHSKLNQLLYYFL